MTANQKEIVERWLVAILGELATVQPAPKALHPIIFHLQMALEGLRQGKAAGVI